MPARTDTELLVRRRFNPRARQMQLRRRIQIYAWMLVLGLFFNGLAAIPLQTQVDAAVRVLKVNQLNPEQASSGFVKWLLIVRDALHYNNDTFPFVAYGTDWLGFALIVMAVAFFGCVQHPLRNAWLFRVGMIASVALIPWALILGEVRGVPLGWRLIDCAFGIVGFIPCWLAWRASRELEDLLRAESAED
jgi:hypothetical protein